MKAGRYGKALYRCRIVGWMLCAGLMVAACRPSGGGVDTLTVGVMASMDYVPIAVAREQGFFDQQGVQVEIRKFYSANDRDAAFQSGHIDGTVIDYTGAILQKAGGIDLKLTSACNATFCLMTTRDDIRRIEDLRNRKIGVSRNTVIDFCIELALQFAQIPVAAVEKQEINKIPIRFEMMMRGQSDATALPDPFITLAAAKGARSIVSMEQLGYAVTGIVFHTRSIDRKTPQLEAFYRAYNEAVAYIRSHSSEALQSVLVTDIGFPEALATTVHLPAYTPAEAPRDADLQAAAAWLKKKKLIPESFSLDELSDTRFIQP